MHIVNTVMIGKVFSVRRIEIDGYNDNNEYQKGIPKIEVSFLSESIDDNGDVNPSMDKEQLDDTEYPKYKALENKIVAVPYILSAGSSQKWKIDSNMPIVELKDTFASMVKIEKKTS